MIVQLLYIFVGVGVCFLPAVRLIYLHVISVLFPANQNHVLDFFAVAL